MCTAIKHKKNYFGRNLDLEFELPFTKVVITPRNYKLNLRANNEKITMNHAIIGMAMVVDDYPLYYDAMNEKGLFIAGLNFDGYAKYFDIKNDFINITPFELIPYILGSCSNVKEAKNLLNNMNLINISFNNKLPLSPLHWMMCDEDECIVIESTKNGLNIYDNPLKTLANNPEFPYHLENMNHYANLNPNQRVELYNKNIKIISNGTGTTGLPGGLASQDRFVRACYTNSTSKCDDNEEADVTQHFHTLKSVAQTRGTVIGHQSKYEITIYTNCYSSKTLSLYYNTYNNERLTGFTLKDNKNVDSDKLTIYDLAEKQDINWVK